MDDVVVGLEEMVDVEGTTSVWNGRLWPQSLSRNMEEWMSHFQCWRRGYPDRTAANTLNRLPVDVLAINESSHKGPRQSSDRYWVRWLDRCDWVHHPKYVLVATSPQELIDGEGLQSKSWRRWFERWGYEAHYWFLRSHEHGGVVRQDRCMLILHRQEMGEPGIKVQAWSPQTKRKGWLTTCWTQSESPRGLGFRKNGLLGRTIRLGW